MGLFLWDSEPSKIFVGDTPISKVFLWDTQVRPSGWWGWHPWANTLLYMPMNSVSQEIDQSGCRDERIYYWAMVSTNKKRLKQTLNERKVTREWLDKLANQSNNILENWEILLTYK